MSATTTDTGAGHGSAQPGDMDPPPEAPNEAPVSDPADDEGVSLVRIGLGMVVVVGVIVTSIHLDNFKAGFASLVAMAFAAWGFHLRNENLALTKKVEDARVARELLAAARRVMLEEHDRTRLHLGHELEAAREEARVAREALDNALPAAEEAARQRVADELEAAREAARVAREALDTATEEREEAVQARERMARLLELHRKFSFRSDEGAWWKNFVGRDGKPIAWSSATHVAALAVKGRGCRGLPVCVPDEQAPEPFFAKDPNLGVEVQVVRNSLTEKLTITLTETRWAPDSPAGVEVASATDAVLIVDDDAAAMVIRDKFWKGYSDIVIARDIGLKAGGEYVRYFHGLRKVPGFVRQATMSMPTHPGASNPRYESAVKGYLDTNPTVRK